MKPSETKTPTIDKSLLKYLPEDDLLSLYKKKFSSGEESATEVIVVPRH